MVWESLQHKWHFFVRGSPQVTLKRCFSRKTAILAEKSADSFARMLCIMALVSGICCPWIVGVLRYRKAALCL